MPIHPLCNPAWSWEYHQIVKRTTVRVYLRGDEEAQFYSLKWSGGRIS
jgi:hypothetical protein